MSRIILVGMGGIGSQGMMPLCQFLNFKYPDKFELTVCDGDDYEESNLSRQIFNDFDNKAVVATNLLRSMFKEMKITAVKEYITKYWCRNRYKCGHIIKKDIDLDNFRNNIADKVPTKPVIKKG